MKEFEVTFKMSNHHTVKVEAQNKSDAKRRAYRIFKKKQEKISRYTLWVKENKKIGFKFEENL